jgi:heat shock protein HslJ
MRLLDAAVVVLLGVSAAPAAGQEVDTLEGTTWQLTSLPGHEPADLAALPRPVSLRLADGRVTGFTGCNAMSGTYTIKGTSLTLRSGSTLMACPEPGSSIERAFLEALKGPVSHSAGTNRLTLTTASGAVLEFEREVPMALEGRSWDVTLYNNGRQAVVSPKPDTRLTLSFANGQVSGHAGCNTFRATYSAEGDRMTIGPAVTTRKACAEAVMAQERDFLAALASAARWTTEGGVLDMHRADDERALSAKPGSPLRLDK